MSANGDRAAEAIVDIQKRLSNLEAMLDNAPEPIREHSMHKEGEWFYACEACSGLPDGDRQ